MEWTSGNRPVRVVCSSGCGGYTILEIIVALAIIGVLAGIGVATYGSPGARVYANDLRSLIQQARFEAIKRNEPVAVVWFSDESAFAAVRGSDPMQPCAADIVIGRATTAAYPRLRVFPLVAVEGEDEDVFRDVTLEDGLVWLPSGLARSCGFGAFPEVIATISDGRTSLTVTVELTGRVIVE